MLRNIYLSSKPKIYIKPGWHNLSPRENTVEEGKLKLEAQLMSMSSAAAAAAAAKSLQSCPTLCDPKDGSPSGFPIPGFSRQEPWSGLPFPSPDNNESKK